MILLQAFPDLQITVEDMVAEGDKVAVRWRLRATHQGEFMGIPPTGNQVTMTGIDINRLEGGRLVERWGNEDMLGLLQQLGVMGTSASGS
jgi:predicted ester cyclase